MNSLIVYRDEGWESKRITLFGERARFAYNAGASQVGAQVHVALFGGDKGLGTIVEASRERVVIDLTWMGPSLELRAIDLVVGLSRPQTTKKVIQAAVMAGVRSLHLVHLSSGEKSYLDAHLLEESNLRTEVVKALEQIWEGNYPEIRVHGHFGRFVAAHKSLLSTSDRAMRVVAEPGGVALGARQCTLSSAAVIAVGSEGGWSEKELTTLTDLGFVKVGLGTRVVRVEVALLYLLGQTLTIE
ncbi:MAG: RsmE family RNA methyltransferase [Pseudomonadota bacterium]|jgi:16S rRNA (uracil1498-N3)-methyltransferase